MIRLALVATHTAILMLALEQLVPNGMWLYLAALIASVVALTYLFIREYDEGKL